MIDPVPFYVGGGAVHSPSDVRGLVYAATSGGTGIINPTDFKVVALPTPGGAVRVLPGTGAARNRYPGVSSESYTIRARTATDVPVSATGSTGASTRYLIARVRDPQFAGEAAPASIPNGPYVFLELVASITNLAYPHIVLARIDQPANTAAITQAMITDLRQLASPNSHVEAPTKQGFPNLALSKTDGFMLWPGFTPQVRIPEWANQAKVIVTINGAKQAGGFTIGNLFTRFAGQDTQHMAFDSNTPNTANNIATMPPLMDRWDGWIPENLRGTVQGIEVWGRRNVAPNDPGYVNADSFTQVIIQVIFGQTVA